VHIIGIAGAAGAGKDTVANYLRDEHAFTVVAFADKLKRIVMDLYDFSEEQMWGPSALRNAPDHRYPKDHGTFMCPRDPLKTIGTEGARAAYDSTWIDYVIRVISQLRTGDYFYNRVGGLVEPDRAMGNIWCQPQGVVISDLRFKNEMKAIKDIGGALIRVKRPENPFDIGTAHRSEAEQEAIPDSEFDFVILNDGSVVDLYFSVDEVMNVIKGRV
jgi:hypothetical protein